VLSFKTQLAKELMWPRIMASDRSVHRLSSFSTCALNGHLLTVTIPDAVLIQFDLLRISKILLETCTY